MDIHETVILIFIVMSGYLFGWLFTESREYNIAKWIPKLNHKPFNCRPCMTFHLIWIVSGITALTVASLRLFVSGFLMAWIIFIALYIHSKQQIDD